MPFLFSDNLNNNQANIHWYSLWHLDILAWLCGCFSFPICRDNCGTSQMAPSGKESACPCRRHKRLWSNSGVRKIPWSGKWQPTPVFLPGKIPWTEEPHGLQFMGSKRLGHDWAPTHTHTHKIRVNCILVVVQSLKSCPTLCDPMDCSMPGFPVLHNLPKLAQTHVHWVGEAIQPSRLLSSPSPAFSFSQHQKVF